MAGKRIAVIAAPDRANRSLPARIRDPGYRFFTAFRQCSGRHLEESAMITPPVSQSATAVDNPRLRAAAQDLEAGFIAEMLRAAGAERTPGLGSNENSEFASFLLDARAREIARAGGLGLAEVLFESLARHDAPR
jgi:Rod binding domain-containing protein